MATAILRRNPNPRCLSDPDRGRPRRRKRSPESIGARPAAAPASKSLVMGQVKILKRGEPLTAFAAARHGSPSLAAAAKGKIKKGDPDLALGSTDRIGPDPETVQRQIRVGELPGVYAGPGMCVSSPPPSSVPVPCFLGKNDLATCSLRRLLGLHLS
ncbi:uncharacterized protein LOC115687413 [Syzygium oleosum]|uniref:uncharacterized protein LOC115687413 n=1 Tax=Syzygium oleosum TaxID=219896 RepID=UPI0011D2B924|nr:uncharacterized protein LOC115687413 [Syzygium oleosum]